MVRPTLPSISTDPADEWGQQVLDGFEYAFDTSEQALADAAAAQADADTANTGLTGKLDVVAPSATRFRGIYATEGELPTGQAGDFAIVLD